MKICHHFATIRMKTLCSFRLTAVFAPFRPEPGPEGDDGFSETAILFCLFAPLIALCGD
jgi:hypothetical protein